MVIRCTNSKNGEALLNHLSDIGYRIPYIVTGNDMYYEILSDTEICYSLGKRGYQDGAITEFSDLLSRNITCRK